MHPAVPLTHVGAMVQAAPGDEGGSPDATPAAPEEMSSPDLIVDDDAADLAPGQMRKSDFLALLQSAVCGAATEALAGTAWSATGCPYIAYWFQYYAGRDARQVQRAIRLYVPGQTDVADAHDYISIITGHVRDAVTKWAATGCPYIAYCFQYYAGRDARQVQRAIRLYVPGQTDVADAHDYISII